MLAGAYAALGNFEKGFRHSIQAKQYSDSLYNEQRVKLSSELEAKYQNEKNQKEIASLNAAREINTLKLQKRRNERNYLMGVALDRKSTRLNSSHYCAPRIPSSA